MKLLNIIDDYPFLLAMLFFGVIIWFAFTMVNISDSAKETGCAELLGGTWVEGDAFDYCIDSQGNAWPVLFECSGVAQSKCEIQLINIQRGGE